MFAPMLTAYWAQPWCHVDFAGLLMPARLNDDHFLKRTYLGYGGHFSGVVQPGWFEWEQDDFPSSVIVGERIGPYSILVDQTLVADITGPTTNGEFRLRLLLRRR